MRSFQASTASLLLLVCVAQAWAATGEEGKPQASLPAEKVGPSGGSQGGKGSVAMCVITRDEHRYLREWVEHYLKLGVSTIYLYDHASRPPLITVLQDYALNGPVVYTWLTDDLIRSRTNETWTYKVIRPDLKVNAQLFAYEHCIHEYRNRHQWLAFFDSDEFLILRDRNVEDLPTFMEAYRPYGGLVVRGMKFASSGHKASPNGSVLQNYWRCFLDKSVKSIVNTDVVRRPNANPHIFLYEKGVSAVDEDFRRHSSDTHCPDCTVHKVVLYHYVTKSREDFLAKVARGSGDGNHKPIDYFTLMEHVAKNNCTDAVELMKGRKWKGFDRATRS